MGRPRLVGIVLLVTCATLAFALSRQWRAADVYAGSYAYARVDNWLESAECTRRCGAFLATCEVCGAVTSIEETQGADDLGHTLLANVLAWGRTEPITRRTLTRLNLVLNAVGLLGVSAALWLSGFRAVAVLAVFVGLEWGVPGPLPGPDTMAAFFAVYCLAWVPVLWVSTLDLDRVTWRRGLAGGVVSVLALTAAVLIRQPIGLAGVASALTLLAWRAARRRPFSRRWIAACAGLALLLCLPTQAARGLVALRSRLSDVPPGRRLVEHGISHNLYIGLGVYPNPWGIEWVDTNGRFAVARVDPSSKYATPAYFRTLWRLYLDVVQRDPIGVAYVYLRKAGDTLAYGGLSTKLFAVLVLLGSAWRWVPRNGRPWLRVLAGSTLLAFLVLLQGVLAKPWWGFYYPAVFGVDIVLLGVVEVSWRTLFDRWRPVFPSGEVRVA